MSMYTGKGTRRRAKSDRPSPPFPFTARRRVSARASPFLPNECRKQKERKYQKPETRPPHLPPPGGGAGAGGYTLSGWYAFGGDCRPELYCWLP